MPTPPDISITQYIDVFNITSKLLFLHALLIIFVMSECFKLKFLNAEPLSRQPPGWVNQWRYCWKHAKLSLQPFLNSSSALILKGFFLCWCIKLWASSGAYRLLSIPACKLTKAIRNHIIQFDQFWFSFAQNVFIFFYF